MYLSYLGNKYNIFIVQTPFFIVKFSKNYIEIHKHSFDGKLWNVCSFCNSPISMGQSICKDCINLYDIKISNHENDGCGCDS